MKQLLLPSLLLIACASPTRAQFADAVVNYDPGTGYATEFGTGDPYTIESSALGEPTREIPGEFGGPVTPFNAPYQKEQLLSLGEGGTVTVRFDTPVQNHSSHPYGLDFLIFGGTAFIDSDFPNGVTDGTPSLFGNNTGSTRVYVGNDPGLMFLLNPSLTPVVDGLFPTDGQGNFRLPVNPALDPSAFANKTLGEIRGLYQQSGGGTGFDIGWAVDDQGQPVDLESVQYVRVDVLTGRSEIDAFSTVMVPEPSTILLGLTGIAAIWSSRRLRRG